MEKLNYTIPRERTRAVAGGTSASERIACVIGFTTFAGIASNALAADFLIVMVNFILSLFSSVTS